MQSERIEIDKMECDSMEEQKNFVSQCVSDRGNVALVVDEQGFLWKGTVQSAKDVDWQRYDFNQEYRGYYPECCFTTVAWTGNGFLAVGQEVETHRTVAYSSLRGGVWNPENLVAQTPEGPRIPREPVYHICQDKVSGQTFLLGGKGQVITLNGCPKCVKISFFGKQDIRQGRVEGEYLHLTLVDGTEMEVYLHAAMQLHLSEEAAERKHAQGGIYVYVGDESEENAEMQMQQCSLAELNGFLRTCAEEQILLFVCPSGVRAEAAAKSARAQGYREAYYFDREKT